MAAAAQIHRRTGCREGSERLRREIEESLRRVADHPAKRTELRVTCDRVIRACIQRLGEQEPEDEEQEEEGKLCEGHLRSLVGLAELACEGYQASAPSRGQGQGPLYLERLLFHLLKGAACRGALESCLALSERLQRGLELWLAGAAAGEAPLLRDCEVVAKNGFGVLWKGGGGAGDRRLALSLRLRALRLLALAAGAESPRPLSSVSARFAWACALYLRGAPPPSGQEAEHLRREFEGLLPAVLPGGGGGAGQLCACELALQCCGTLCRAGHPSLALEALTRAQALLGPAVPPHFSWALQLGRLGCSLGAGPGPSLAPAARALRSLPPGDPWQSRALGRGCQFLLSALDAPQGTGPRLGAGELPHLAEILHVQVAAAPQLGEEDMVNAPGQLATLKQNFHNLEFFTRTVYHLLLEPQGENAVGAEQLLTPCRKIVEKMVEVEEAILSHGLTDYVGATALRLYNLAYGFYSQKLFSEAAEIAVMLRGDVQPPNLFSRSSLPLDKVPRYFKLLAECYRKTGRLDLAMESVGMWLMALGDQRRGQMTEPIALWVSIKADAVKSGHEDLQLRTLKDTLQPWELEPVALAELLVEELRAYKRLRTDTSQERFNVICDLIQMSSSSSSEEGSGGKGMEHLRAMQLLELAQLLSYRDFSQHAECSAMDCVEEALTVLGSLPQTPENRHQLLDDQAHAFLWQYICDLESRIRMSVERSRRAGTVPDALSELEDSETNDLNYEDRQQGALSVHDCIDFNLAAENHCRIQQQLLEAK
ncbi:separin [Carcharodon carcharias]|uniref:separin n=1 Tax=Carcharodon carcharias TaxID=13397 RepID=UPI001B7EE30B|nr:separin [Carcharodon carcharias]